MSESVSVDSAITPNLAVIHQGIDLLATLGNEAYVRCNAAAFHASIGGHMRHIIEHYQSFLSSLETGVLDYENRPRSQEIETDAEVARSVLVTLAERLRRLGPELADRPLAYCVETAPGKHSPSSVVRELEFLLSHTIHHFALVAVMCRLLGREPGPDFGIAPSTLRYQRTLAPCAP